MSKGSAGPLSSPSRIAVRKAASFLRSRRWMVSGLKSLTFLSSALLQAASISMLRINGQNHFLSSVASGMYSRGGHQGQSGDGSS
jgi:hypothetical protein